MGVPACSSISIGRRSWRRNSASTRLHLAMRAQSGGLHTPTIIIGEPDALVEAEAHQLHAQHVSQPIEDGAFAKTARRLTLLARRL